MITAHVGGGLAGFTALAISSDGRRAVVDRSRCGTSAVSELVSIEVATGARTVGFRQPKVPVVFAGVAPGGRWLLFWADQLCSASIAADGMPLQAVRAAGGKPVRAIGHTLLYPDYLTWCGRLIAAAGAVARLSSAAGEFQSAPPAWRQLTIDSARARSWVSPLCAPSGRRLVAVACLTMHRSASDINIARSGCFEPTALGDPPPEQPTRPRSLRPGATLLNDGRWIMFVRARVIPVGRSAISEDTIELVRADGNGGAVPIAPFTSDDFSYYDHFAWPEEIAWFSGRPRAPQATVTPACRISQLAVGRGQSTDGRAGKRR